VINVRLSETNSKKNKKNFGFYNRSERKWRITKKKDDADLDKDFSKLFFQKQ